MAGLAVGCEGCVGADWGAGVAGCGCGIVAGVLGEAGAAGGGAATGGASGTNAGC